MSDKPRHLPAPSDDDGIGIPYIERALEIAFRYGSIDGEHHKEWVIDQMVRELTGHNYEEWVRRFRSGDDGPESYDWPVGIAP